MIIYYNLKYCLCTQFISHLNGLSATIISIVSLRIYITIWLTVLYHFQICALSVLFPMQNKYQSSELYLFWKISKHSTSHPVKGQN